MAKRILLIIIYEIINVQNDKDSSVLFRLDARDITQQTAEEQTQINVFSAFCGHVYPKQLTVKRPFTV